VSRSFGGQLVVLHLATAQFFGLNTIGTIFWNELIQAASIPDGVERLATYFQIDRDWITQDAWDFIAALRECGLIDVEASSGSSGQEQQEHELRVPARYSVPDLVHLAQVRDLTADPFRPGLSMTNYQLG
jgi:hypothetical protein